MKVSKLKPATFFQHNNNVYMKSGNRNTTTSVNIDKKKMVLLYNDPEVIIISRVETLKLLAA